jgi:hypothetical protein
MRRRVFAIVLCGIAALPTPAARAQVIIDRVVERVYGQVLTQSDVWQALTLRLVDATGFDQAQRELENRILLLREATRVITTPAADAAVAERRAQWEAKLGAGDAPAVRLERAGVSEAALTAWFRETIRIETYLAQRFNGVAQADRAAAIAAWVRQLRERAGLPWSPSQLD